MKKNKNDDQVAFIELNDWTREKPDFKHDIGSWKPLITRVTFHKDSTDKVSDTDITNKEKENDAEGVFHLTWLN